MPSAQLYRCHHVYAPQRDDELGMEPGDLIMIRSQPHLDWWIGDNLRTGQKEAWFPYNFVDPVEPPTLTPPPPPPHRRTPSQTPPQLTITATPQNETSAVPIVSAIPQPPSADQAGAAVSAVLNTVQKRHKHQQQHQQQQHQHQHQSRLPSPKVHSSSSDKRVITLRRSQNQLSFDGSDTGSPISSGIGSALHLTKTSDSSNSGGIGNSSMRFKRPPPPPPPPHPSYPQHHPHPHLPQLQMQGQTGRHGLSSNPCVGLSPPPPPPSLSPPPPMPTAIPSIASILDGSSSSGGGGGGGSNNDSKTPTRSANTFTSSSTVAGTSTERDHHGIGKVNDQEADKSPVDSACHSTIISPQKNLSLSASVVSSLHHTVASKSSTSSLKVQPTASFFVNNIEPKSMSAASSPMVPVVTNKNDTAKLPNITSVNQLAASTTNRIAELQKRFATRRAAACDHTNITEADASADTGADADTVTDADNSSCASTFRYCIDQGCSI
ncbi:hypothetical protein GQ42DRAFT_157284 [Ramicandelaber brevisporus]|nr:hypothetical protein GQ42DRAFT_157284 [Ramicandelaber brevisporus]